MTPRSVSRRRALGMALAAGCAPWLTGRANAPSAQVRETRRLTGPAQGYCGWPTLAQRANGELVLVWSGGRESHVCPFGRVDWMRSYDEGESWTWPQTLTDGPIDDRDAGIVETSSGALLATTFTSLAYEATLRQATNAQWPADRLRKWRAAAARIPEAQRQRQLGQWMLRSEDSGVSWSAPYRVPLNSPHGPIQLSDGRLLYAGKELWNASKRIGVAESIDDGRTWRPLSWIAPLPGHAIQEYHELHAVEASNGDLIVHIRNHNRSLERETLQCRSRDGGRTWSLPESIGVWGLPSHLLRLRDGRLLMSYGYRRKPFGIQVRVSADHGNHWSPPVTVSADGASGDLGYPSTVELRDGSFLTVWYEKRPGGSEAVLRQARWTW